MREQQEQEWCAIEAMYPDFIIPLEEMDKDKEMIICLRIPVDQDVAFKMKIKFPMDYPELEVPKVLEISIVPFGAARWIEGNESIPKVTERILVDLMDQYKDVILFQYIEWIRKHGKEFIEFNGSRERTVSEKKEIEELNCVKDLDLFHGNTFVEKKSKFIAHAALVHSLEKVEQFSRQLLRDKKIANATHNILAFRILRDSGELIENRDDDGESGAGDGMLYTLQKLKVVNIAVIVTRWYGGIQLGPDRFKSTFLSNLWFILIFSSN
jgi:hypothetical protein